MNEHVAVNEAGIPVIEAEGLKKYYKTRGGFVHAVDGISFKIMRGETLGVVEPYVPRAGIDDNPPHLRYRHVCGELPRLLVCIGPFAQGDIGASVGDEDDVA